MYLAVSGSDRARRSRRIAALAAGPDACSIPAKAAATSGASARLGPRGVPGGGQDVLHRAAEVGRAVVGLAEGRPRDPAELADRRGDRRPAQPGRPLIGLGERPAGQEDGGDRELVGRRVREIIGQEGGLLGGPGRRRDALGDLAPATHGGMVYRPLDDAETLVSRGR